MDTLFQHAMSCNSFCLCLSPSPRSRAETCCAVPRGGWIYTLNFLGSHLGGEHQRADWTWDEGVWEQSQAASTHTDAAKDSSPLPREHVLGLGDMNPHPSLSPPYRMLCYCLDCFKDFLKNYYFNYVYKYIFVHMCMFTWEWRLAESRRQCDVPWSWSNYDFSDVGNGN